MNTCLHTAAALLALCAASGPAAAVDSARTHFQNAVGVCQPALPAFDGNIRKRPVALANEGAATAFVSCSLPRAQGMAFGNELETYGIATVTVRVYNRTGAAADVGCTLVSGWDAPNSNYSTKVITVPANGSAFESWDAGDNGGSRILQPNFNCSLPPGLDIGYFYYDYIADIGD